MAEKHIALLTALSFAFSLGHATPQSAGTVRGRVSDIANAPVSGARITAANGTVTQSVVTDPDGAFVLSLDPGRYTLTAAAPGLRDTSQVLTVAAHSSQTCDFVLPLAAVREAVTVIESANYQVPIVSSATKTLTPLRDVPQSITVVPQEQIKDQMMMSIGDVVRYVPGITAVQGENNRDQLVIRGNSTSADFFLDGVRDDVQYYRDLYSLERVEALKGPNAMTFGRGGGGGVVNRVSKEAGPARFGEISALGGSYGDRRFTADLNQPLSSAASLRLNAMYESSDSFRKFVNLTRHGINPTLTIAPDSKTKITLTYENFRDDRVADRGISSFQGKPLDIDPSTYFGDPTQSHVGARVNLGSAMIEHQFRRFTVHNRTLFGDYDRGYQNYVPGAVSADRSTVSLSAYNNATHRRNFFNQTDFTHAVQTGRLRHTLLAGVEFGRQLTDNFRNTGYFNDSATALLAPLADPSIHTPITFRQSAADANNHLITSVGAVYFQDQLELTRRIQFIAELRVDRFNLRYHNNRNGDDLNRIDHLASPRAGFVYKPTGSLSLYTNYSVSYLPSSGDQFSSLTTVTQQVKPEKFNSYEVGAKWDASRTFSLTTAVYRLDRTNTRSTDPNDPTRIVQTGSQRTNGYELGVNGSLTRRWTVAGGYAYQDAFVTSATSAARAGAQVAQVPHHTFSLWNNFRILPKWGAGFGVINRSGMFAAIDDTVRLPGHTRADAAMYYSVTDRVRLQANVENLSDRKYFVNADNNTNISPGFARTVRVGLITRF
jgi:catecholate siderophore receptor